MQTELREVLHHYTEEELNAVREKYTDAEIRIEDEVKKMKLEVTRFKNRIKEMQSGALEIRQNIRNKSEQRMVECEVVPNYARRVMEFVDSKTGEIVGSRRMTPDERQLELPTLKKVAGE